MSARALGVHSPAAIPLGLATAIGALAIGLRFVDPRGGLPGLTTAALPLLFTAALLCAGVLLRRRFLPAAWVASVIGAGLACVEVLGSVRAWEGIASAAEWPQLVVVAELALVATASVAAAYAVRGRPGMTPALDGARRIVILGGLLGIAMVAAWTVIATLSGAVPAPPLASGASDLPPLRLSGRLTAGFVVVAAVAGLWLDLATPVRRARANAKARGGFPRALADELFPTASGLQRRGRQEERARLAADLHALVLPDLRRASHVAEASGAGGEPLAASLRQAVQGVERLMHERQSVVLEGFGLVAALEWLAERTEEQSSIKVVIDLDDAVGEPDGLQKDVSRAAFRVAMLAVDNVLRHAVASRLELRLALSDGGMRLSIVDDGKGLEPASQSRGGRGVADMRSAADEVGARISQTSGAQGTKVEFGWSRAHQGASQPATAVGAPADRRNALNH